MPIDHFSPSAANAAVAQAGYSAPYLYLLEDDKLPQGQRQRKSFQERRIHAIAKACRDGAGQGREDLYKPWIRIRRNFSSPYSHQAFSSVALRPTNHHFLSKLEFHTALHCAYLGATELRECLPEWPHDHPHPHSGLLDDDEFRGSDVCGLLDIARHAGIDHGVYVGTNVPYVASLDLMFRFPWKRRWRYVGISCKPEQIFRQSSRAQERVELDRFYCNAIDTRHVLEDGAAFNQVLVQQMQWMLPLTSEARCAERKSKLCDFAGRFEELAEDRPVLSAVLGAGNRLRLNREDSLSLFRQCVWLHLIDIDLTKHVQMRKQINRGGPAVIAALKARYLGVSHA